MKRSIRLVYSVLSLILMNIAFWQCNYYPRHIIEQGSIWSIVGIILNIIYFILYNYILITIFKKNKAPFFEEQKASFDANVKKTYFKNIAILVGIQLAFEVLNAVCVHSFAPWSPIATDLLMMAHWMAIYVFLTRHNNEITFRKSKAAVMILSLVLLLGVSIAFDVKTALDYLTVEEKHLPFSPYTMQAISNAEFIYGTKSLIFESMIAIIFTVYHFSGVESDRPENKKAKLSILRIAIMLFSVVVICALKFVIYPPSSIVALNISANEDKNHEEYGPFDSTTQTFTVYRMSGRSNKIASYQKNYTTIQEGEMTPVEFEWINVQKDYNFTGNEMVIRDKYKELTIDGKKVYFFENSVICFYENNTPRAVRLYDLSDFEKNDTVIKICEQLISDGNMRVFEYGAEYLLKHDGDFIKPYIERYASVDFNSDELKWLSEAYYNSEYIRSLAHDLQEN